MSNNCKQLLILPKISNIFGTEACIATFQLDGAAPWSLRVAPDGPAPGGSFDGSAAAALAEFNKPPGLATVAFVVHLRSEVRKIGSERASQMFWS